MILLIKGTALGWEREKEEINEKIKLATVYITYICISFSDHNGLILFLVASFFFGDAGRVCEICDIEICVI